MQIKERDIYHKMVRKLAEYGTLLQRIEMDHVPDLFYRTWKDDGWIELKVLKTYPKRKSIIKVPFRPGQMNWIKQYRGLGGLVFLFLLVENVLWIFKGQNIQLEYSQNEIKKLSCYCGLWKKTDWENIHNLLNKQPSSINLL